MAGSFPAWKVHLVNLGPCSHRQGLDDNRIDQVSASCLSLDVVNSSTRCVTLFRRSKKKFTLELATLRIGSSSGLIPRAYRPFTGPHYE